MTESVFHAAVASGTLVGQRVNNYEVRSVLGEGGMGTVYVAEHPVIGRKVAVKVLRRELSEDPKLVARFINEARAANAISHPNIVQILDVGSLPDGVPYLVMELLDGESLGARIARVRRVRMGDAVEFAYQAAGALTAAHNAGIIHRDLKPDNLFLTPDPAMPGRERVKVLDFGIAKLRAELSGGSVRTNTGAVMGTPPYMSPEQCLGKASEIDQCTDIYAMGIILFEMLCGQPPFVAEGFGEVLLMHMSQPPPSPRAINPGIPPHIEHTILKSLQKDKNHRFQSMAEFQKALSDGPARTISGASEAVDPLAPTAPVRESDVGGGGVKSVVPPARTQILGVPSESSRPSTTFSSMSGSVIARDLARTRSRRPVVIAAGVGTAAIVAVVLAFALGGRAERAVTSGGRGPEARPAAVVPVAVPPPPAAVAPEPVAPAPSPQPAPAAGLKRPAAKKPAVRAAAAPVTVAAPAPVAPSVPAAAPPETPAPKAAAPQKPAAAPPETPAPKATNKKADVLDQFDRLIDRPKTTP